MAFRTNKTPVLQEKSASGSVATFNTALAMPLVNGEFTIEAYQEGSGDPSPVNVRNIVPFNTQKMTKTGKNLYNGVRTFANPSNTSSQNVNRTFTPNSYCLGLTSNNYMAVTLPPSSISDVVVNSNSISFYNSSTSGTAYITLVCPVLNLKWGETYIVSGTRTNCYLYVSFYKQDGTYIVYEEPNRRFTVPAETYYTCLVFRAAGQGTVSYSDIQLELGSTPTDYEPYIEPEIKTVALGEDVYGGSYNSVTGDKKKTHLDFTIDENSTPTAVNWLPTSDGVGWFYQFNNLDLPPIGVAEIFDGLCDILKPVTYNQIYAHTERGAIIAITNNASIKRVYVWQNDTTLIDVASIKAWIKDNPIHLTYPIATPIESNIGATPIETYDGVNNIFCDTGDTSLTYKDLDIAKRGNFREVFKLPS